MEYSNPNYLIEVEALSNQLNDDNVRIFDAAVFLIPRQTGGYQVDSGFDKYRQAHIPGAGFIDLKEAWADSSSPLNFTVPPIDTLAAAIGKSGIGNDNQVVLYSSGHLMWATRAWWLLHYAGHPNVAILNGNINAWREAGYPLDSDAQSYAATTFIPQENPACIANTEQMVSGMDGNVCTINALSQALYEGTGNFYYTRPGHIPGSKLLNYDTLLDNEHFLPAPALGEQLESQRMLSAQNVIAYCGGGIAATVDAFACKLMGQNNAAVYDGSMSEWVLDENRPLTLGPNP